MDPLASAFRTHRSSFASAFPSPKATGGFTKPKTKKHHGLFGGVVGFVDHLADDVRDAAVGIPTGMVQLFKHPIGTSEAIGKATWQDWSPYFSGVVHGEKGVLKAISGDFHGAGKEFGKSGHDLSKFGHQFYDHPLGPILDVAAVFTGGGAVVGKAARTLSEAGVVSPGSKLGRLAEYSKGGTLHIKPNEATGEAGPALTKTTSKNPWTRLQQEKMHQVANIVGPHLPAWTKASSRYHRLELKVVAGRTAAMKFGIGQIFSAAEKMSGPERHTYLPMLLKKTHEDMQHFAFEHDPTKAIPKDYVPVVKRSGQNFYNTSGDVVTDMRGVSRRFTTMKVKTPLQIDTAIKRGKLATRNGKVLIVPKHTIDKMGMEGAHAGFFAKNLYHRPTTVWKAALLGYSPRYFVNNAVGNFFMYALAQGGSHSMAAFIDGVRHLHGEKAAQKMLKQGMHATPGSAAAERILKPGLIGQHFKNQLAGGHAYNVSLAHERLGAKNNKLRQGLFPITHKLADQSIRVQAMYAAFRDAPEIQAALKKAGATGPKKYTAEGHRALEKAVSDVLHSPKADEFRARVSEQVNDIMGDYHTLGATERKIKDLVPFWTWNRHIMRYSGKRAFKQPGRTAATVQLGYQGTQTTEKYLGQLPTYLKGLVPLTLLGMKGDKGKLPVFQTQGINPFASVPELVDAASGAAHALVSGKPQDIKLGETLGAQLNPLVGSAIEHISGHSLLSDAPPDHSIIGGIIHSLPQVKIADEIVSPSHPKVNKRTGKATPFMLSKDEGQAIRAWLGVPSRSINPERAKAQYRKEHHIKKKKAPSKTTKPFANNWLS